MEVSEKSNKKIPSVSDVPKKLHIDLDEKIAKVEEYRKSKLNDDDDIINPVIQYMNEKIFIILAEILEKMLFRAKETNSLKYHRSTYNALDFIAVNLWNSNPKHPERKENWTDLFDMDWVKKHLELSPRPYFPLSWIWSKEYAAVKIQSRLRGYWVRRGKVVEVKQEPVRKVK